MHDIQSLTYSCSFCNRPVSYGDDDHYNYSLGPPNSVTAHANERIPYTVVKHNSAQGCDHRYSLQRGCEVNGRWLWLIECEKCSFVELVPNSVWQRMRRDG